MNVLFVCTGNTCRSIMAEGMLKDMLSKRNVSEHEIKVASAGISAIEGQAANLKSIIVLSEIGIDIKDYKAKQLTFNLADKSDLILTMSMYHKKCIVENAPDLKNKVFTLKEYSDIVNPNRITRNNLDIDDPYGMDYNVYEDCMNEIKKELESIVQNLIELK